MLRSAYHFDGDPVALAAAHARLSEDVSLETLELQLCGTHDTGIVGADCRERAPT